MTVLQDNSLMAQDLAGKAILFEIGAQSRILEYLEYQDEVSVKKISQNLKIQPDFVETYLKVFENLGLIKLSHDDIYQTTPAYYEEKNKIGYINWGMVSCAPLILNTRHFTEQFDNAVKKYTRCGEHVARTSKWMGDKDFYPHAEKVILDLQPKKMIDLGSGTCGLLIRLTQKLSSLKGIGVDISEEACEKARQIIANNQLQDRINVEISPIQNLIENKAIFTNVDIVHAGFVFHDLLPDEEETLDKLLRHINQTAPKATLVIVDAIPFSNNTQETAFSSAFTFLHKFFMGRKLLSETEWKSKLNEAGFNNVRIEKLGISGGRIFVAST